MACEITGEKSSKVARRSEERTLTSFEAQRLIGVCVELLDLCAKVTGRIDPALGGWSPSRTTKRFVLVFIGRKRTMVQFFRTILDSKRNPVHVFAFCEFDHERDDCLAEGGSYGWFEKLCEGVILGLSWSGSRKLLRATARQRAFPSRRRTWGAIEPGEIHPI